MAGIEIDTKSTNHQQLFKQGLRAYILQDNESAVQAFSRCSELLALEFNDDQHDSLGEVYLYYGKSLLGLSRQEMEPLNENIIKNEEEQDDDDEDNDDDGNGEENAGGEQKDTNDETKQEKMEDETMKVEENGTSGVNGDDKQGETSAETDENNKATEEKEEELTDLQVAWEVLELAKKIFTKRGNDGKSDLAETLIVLGEISLESGNFQIGIDDIRNGLDLQKQLYKNDDRTLAETYYKLGTALSTNQQIDEAIEQFQKSLESLQLRLDQLKETAINNEEEVEDEIKEINELIPEIEEKINDMKAYKIELLKKSENGDKTPAAAAPSSSSSPSASSSSSKLANDISHLVKRKRPTEDSASNGGGDTDEKPAKKLSQ